MAFNWDVHVKPQLTARQFAPLIHRRNRHGRNQRGPMIRPGLPGWATRAQIFDEIVWEISDYLTRTFEPAKQVEFCVEDVPPSDPAPWEHSVRLGRAFGPDRRAGLRPRVIVYRLPIMNRAGDMKNAAEIVRGVLVENLAALYCQRPEDIDPGYWPQN